MWIPIVSSLCHIEDHHWFRIHTEILVFNTVNNSHACTSGTFAESVIRFAETWQVSELFC